MNTKMIIIGAIAVIVLGGVYSMSRPKEAGAPVTMDTNTDASALPAPTSTVPETPQGAPTGVTTNATPQTTTVAPRPGTSVPVPTTPAPAPFVATVYYDGENFVPEVITIVEGGTVVFENTSDRMMWVGSDDHPTHARYPVKGTKDCLGSSFDQCTATGKGTSWSYTFTELGEWKYHNHVRVRDTGEVVVLTKEAYLKYKEKEESGQ